MNMESVDKHLSEENFRKLGLEGVIRVLLPVIREIIMQGDKSNNELKQMLTTEELKNSELHKIIVNIALNVRDTEIEVMTHETL